MVRRRLGLSEPAVTDGLLAAVRSRSRPLRSAADLDPLLERIGDARCVLLGEASHGTHEYYTWRAEISKRLIAEKGFSLIAVEGDWPDCYHVNRFVRGEFGTDARDVLHAFARWPTWMWANEEVADLADWLRGHNARGGSVGFYGLDVYSLWDSLYQVLGYLGKHAPSALPGARRAFGCFEPYGEDAQEYARATRWVDASCEDEVVALLADVRRAAKPDEAGFDAEQNALVVRNAERYYRTMVRGGPESWNVRDRHMMDTLDRLVRRHGKAIVWEHNTHIGDARFTDMAGDGMVNVGQLARERYGADTVLVGFGSHRGRVIAGREWDAPMERMEVPPGRVGSWEDVLHRVGPADRLLLFDGAGDAPLARERGHRAIGVVYHPHYESFGNYVPTVLPRRYDAFLFLDRTEALRPLHLPASPEEEEVPETFPSGE
jgi:erythromycin esterase